MTLARQRLSRGTRVQMTTEAIAQQLDGRFHRRTGTVVGYSRKYAGMIRIQRDGAWQAERYHPSFWEPI